MRLVVNGEPREVPAGSTVEDLLRHVGVNPASVVVERNGEIVSREDFESTGLADGDRIEIVRFVGGG